MPDYYLSEPLVAAGEEGEEYEEGEYEGEESKGSEGKNSV